MANARYTKYKEALLLGLGPDLMAANVCVALIDTEAYAVDIATDEFLGDIPGGAILSTSAPLAGKSITGGVFNADDTSFSGVAPAEDYEAIVLYVDTGNPATSRLLYYADTGVGFGEVSASGVVQVAWNVSGIFGVGAN